MAAGMSSNAVRETKSLKFSKNYFDKGIAAVRGQAVATSSGGGSSSGPHEIAQGEQPDEGPAPQPVQPPPGEPGQLDHPFQEILFDEVVEVFNDPATAQGLNLFIDARDDEHYAEGHIPGAIQCDPYQIERYLQNTMDRINGVERIIVYCNGGECEDSIFMCRELVEAGVLPDTLDLYPGGWKEWTARNMPVARGRSE